MRPINQWHPGRFSDFIGEKNIPVVRRIQSFVKNKTGFAGAFIGPMGVCKTRMARLVTRAFLCQNPDAISGDPCNVCKACVQVGPTCRGAIFSRQLSWINAELQTSRQDLCDLIAELQSGHVPPLFVIDEIQRFSETKLQEVLLNFVTDLQGGVFICTVMTGGKAKGRSIDGLLPALRNRLNLLPFQRPEPSEVTRFLLQHLDEWRIRSTPANIAKMVASANGSIRTCLNALEEARVVNKGILDIAFIRDLLPAANLGGVSINPLND